LRRDGGGDDDAAAGILIPATSKQIRACSRRQAPDRRVSGRRRQIPIRLLAWPLETWYTWSAGDSRNTTASADTRGVGRRRNVLVVWMAWLVSHSHAGRQEACGKSCRG